MATSKHLAPGHARRGIFTFDDLQERCIVDEITGCWHCTSGTLRGRPYLWLPAIGRQIGVGAVICWLTLGRLPNRGEIWHQTCESKDCASPTHHIAGNRSTLLKHARPEMTPMHRERLRIARIAWSPISEDDVREIRESDGLLSECAARIGCSESAVSKIRRGVSRRPTQAPGASVFAWRG